MSYGQGGGSSAAISTCSDVALSNPITGNVLTYSTNTGKWSNGASTSSYPLGSAENPQTSASAARNVSLPVNWWSVPTGTTITNLGTSGFTDVVLYT